MVGKEGKSSSDSVESIPWGCLYLTPAVRTRKTGVALLPFSLLELLGICRAGMGVLLLWRLGSHSQMESGCA